MVCDIINKVIKSIKRLLFCFIRHQENVTTFSHFLKKNIQIMYMPNICFYTAGIFKHKLLCKYA